MGQLTCFPRSRGPVVSKDLVGLMVDAVEARAKLHSKGVASRVRGCASATSLTASSEGGTCMVTSLCALDAQAPPQLIPALDKPFPAHASPGPVSNTQSRVQTSGPYSGALCAHGPGDQTIQSTDLWSASSLRTETSLAHLLLLGGWRGPGLEHRPTGCLKGYDERHLQMLLQSLLGSPDTWLPCAHDPPWLSPA